MVHNMVPLERENCVHISCAACYLLTFALSRDLQHAFKDGTLEEVRLRHLGAADGSTVIVKNVRYTSSSSFEIVSYL
jgi:hypothetical protein